MKQSKYFLLTVMVIVSLLVLFAHAQNTQQESREFNPKTVKIGDQTWMAENLNVTTFRNGDSIPEARTNEEWKKAGEEGKPVWCYYNNNSEKGEIYGKLFNWYAVNDPRNLAPEGWHVATDEEWKKLEMYLGMSQLEADSIRWRGTNEGGKLKEIGTTHWSKPNTGAVNEIGFFALPGGLRFGNGLFYFMGDFAGFWTATEGRSGLALYRSFSNKHSGITRDDYNKNHGFSVRLVRD